MGYAYDGVARLFTDESGELFNSLSLSARYELLNNFSKGETVEVVNNLRTTESRITQLTSDHMVVATSSARTVEMKLLPRAKGDTVLDALLCQSLGLVHHLATAIVAVSRITLGILVCQAATHSLHNLVTYEVLTGNELNATLLTQVFTLDDAEQ